MGKKQSNPTPPEGSERPPPPPCPPKIEPSFEHGDMRILRGHDCNQPAFGALTLLGDRIKFEFREPVSREMLFEIFGNVGFLMIDGEMIGDTLKIKCGEILEWSVPIWPTVIACSVDTRLVALEGALRDLLSQIESCDGTAQINTERAVAALSANVNPVTDR